jgi:hypothetical protein
VIPRRAAAAAPGRRTRYFTDERLRGRFLDALETAYTKADPVFITSWAESGWRGRDLLFATGGSWSIDLQIAVSPGCEHPRGALEMTRKSDGHSLSLIALTDGQLAFGGNLGLTPEEAVTWLTSFAARARGRA